MTSGRVLTASKYLKAADEMDIDAIMSLRSPICSHHYAPASLGELPPLDNATYQASLLRFKDIISGFEITNKEVMEDDKQNRIMIWASARTIWYPAAKDPGITEEEWDFRTEYVFILSMDESQEKIVKVVEFVDSKATEQWRQLVARAMENVKPKA